MKQVLFIVVFSIVALGAGCSEQEIQSKPATGSVETPDTAIELKKPNSNTEITMEDSQLPTDYQDLVSQYNRAKIKTNQGDITVEFYGDDSSVTVNNFLNLAQSGFYNGTRFHRIIKDFMIQGGDPNSADENKRSFWGMGDPGYKFDDEFNAHKLVKGSLAMANSGPNTNGSQFFIVTAEETPWLDGKHTNFGFVVEGMDVVEKLGNLETLDRDVPAEDVIVESIELQPSTNN